jgi:5-methylcytosine-specific restriction endonuclease McrA
MAGNNLTDIHCTDACAKAQRRARRRASKRQAFVADVSPRKIYERDGWRCRLCGRKLKRNAVVPHSLAPTIDHIVPLARGGTHEPSNVQAAHFLCNSLKGDRQGGDQLALIG